MKALFNPLLSPLWIFLGEWVREWFSSLNVQVQGSKMPKMMCKRPIYSPKGPPQNLAKVSQKCPWTMPLVPTNFGAFRHFLSLHGPLHGRAILVARPCNIPGSKWCIFHGLHGRATFLAWNPSSLHVSRPCHFFASRNLRFLHLFMGFLEAFPFCISFAPFSTHFLQFKPSYNHHKHYKNFTIKWWFKGWK